MNLFCKILDNYSDGTNLRRKMDNLRKITLYSEEYMKNIKAKKYQKITEQDDCKITGIVYCYLNIITLDPYIGFTTEKLKDEERNIKNEYLKYLVQKENYDGKYDKKLLEQIKKYGIGMFKICGMDIHLYNNERMMKIVHQFYINELKENISIINEKQSYPTKYSYSTSELGSFIEYVNEEDNE